MKERTSRRVFRQDGLLRKQVRQTVPTHFIIFDTETDIIEHDNGNINFPFKLGVAIYFKLDKKGNLKEREVFKFDKIEDFIAFIEEKAPKKKPFYILAHNIGFDLRVCSMFDRLDILNYESKPPIINNLVFIWEARKEDKKLLFVDTSNYGVRSVERLGIDLGFPKLEVDFKTVTIEELYYYCQRDVEILEKFMLGYVRFLIKYKLGAFKITLASQSLTTFRTNFLDDNVYIHSHNGANKLERDAYYGGRTEAFKLGYIGQQDYYYLDINSMYPYCMKTFPMPFELKGFFKDISLWRLETILEQYYVIADVTIATNSNNYPLRLTNDINSYNYLFNPHEMKYPDIRTKRIIFPVGTFRTSLHHVELVEAFKNGSIKQIHRISYYTKSNPFTDYVNFFYKLKQDYSEQNLPAYRLLAKLWLNTLYGKFGQLQPNREFIGLDYSQYYGRMPLTSEKTGKYYQEITWQGKIYEEWKEGETAFSNPALAGAVTAYARFVLWEYVKKAGKNNVYYVDTDSIITNHAGMKRLKTVLHSSNLGALSLEKTGRRLIIRGNKDYKLDGITRFKGLPSTAIKIGRNLWEYIQFEGFISWLNKGALTEMIGAKRPKSRISSYKKGLIQDDCSIIPFHLLEDYYY